MGSVTSKDSSTRVFLKDEGAVDWAVYLNAAWRSLDSKELDFAGGQ